jgi:hypothetical protein
MSARVKLRRRAAPGRMGGVVSVVVVFGIIMVIPACGPRLRLDPSGATVQEQCGVTGHEPITSDQAKCIAKLAGFEIGIRPWDVTYWRGNTQDPAQWSVCNTLTVSQHGQEPATNCMQIRASDGQILSVAARQRIRVG